MSDTQSLGRAIGKAETKFKNFTKHEAAAICGVKERYNAKRAEYFGKLPPAVQVVLVTGGVYAPPTEPEPETQASA
jgi:hypothetical protein